MQELDTSKKRFWKLIFFWSLGGLVVVAGLWALIVFSSGSNSNQSANDIKLPAVTAKDFQTLPATNSAKVTLTEYADFQCPACKAYYPLVKQLQKDYGDKLNVVYRFFPLKTIHQNAVNSAKAAYASSLQGKFWEMHDKLFENQDNWATLTDPESVFIGYAKDLGLNTDQFKKDYEAGSTLVFINNAYDQDAAIGLNSTPTFFVNGTHITNPQSYDAFKQVIDGAMK